VWLWRVHILLHILFIIFFWRSSFHYLNIIFSFCVHLFDWMIFIFYLYVISEFNHESYAFVNNFWNLFHDKYISRKQMPGPSNQSQVIVQPIHTSLDSQDPNVGAVMNTTPQILQEKYSLQHLSSKFLLSTSLASQFCHFIFRIYHTSQNIR
jgi:hypothetical protein